MRYHNYGSSYESENEEVIFEVGDIVDFKQDVEGCGVVVRVETRRDPWTGYTHRTYFIASRSEPPGYPWHRMARMDYESGKMCVVIEDGYRMYKVD